MILALDSLLVVFAAIKLIIYVDNQNTQRNYPADFLS